MNDIKNKSWNIGDIWEAEFGSQFEVREILTDQTAVLQMIKPIRLRKVTQNGIPDTWKLVLPD